MVEVGGQLAVRGGIVDVLPPEWPRAVRLDLLADTVASVQEFDARTQRSIAPVVRPTFLPLAEWAIGAPPGASGSQAEFDETPGFFGPRRNPGESTLFELAESSLRPIVFLDEPQTLREAAAKHLAAATEAYERHGQATAPPASHYFWSEEELAAGLEKTSQIHLEQRALNMAASPQFELPSRPSPRFHGDVVACMGDVKSQLAAGGSVFLTASSTAETERFADISREYEVPYVLGQSSHAPPAFPHHHTQSSPTATL